MLYIISVYVELFCYMLLCIWILKRNLRHFMEWKYHTYFIGHVIIHYN